MINATNTLTSVRRRYAILKATAPITPGTSKIKKYLKKSKLSIINPPFIKKPYFCNIICLYVEFSYNITRQFSRQAPN